VWDDERLDEPAAAEFVGFEPQLRPLIQLRWAQHVAGLRPNSLLHHANELEKFLFGAERVSLALVTDHLRDLQHGRCFTVTRRCMAIGMSTTSFPGRGTATTVWRTSYSQTASAMGGSGPTLRVSCTSRTGSTGSLLAADSRRIFKTSARAEVGTKAESHTGRREDRVPVRDPCDPVLGSRRWASPRRPACRASRTFGSLTAARADSQPAVEL
jgi:hypothetical protein